MEENEKNRIQADGGIKTEGCGCEDGNCAAIKTNPFRKIIFAIILLAAVGIIAAKLIYKPAAPVGKDAACTPGNSSCCDTSKAKSCDTTKGSSCCPKSK